MDLCNLMLKIEMGDKKITQSGGKGTSRTEKLKRKTWCGSGRMGACGLGCMIGIGKSQKKSKPTRKNYERWTTKTLLAKTD
jgi:hypothetical protein